MIKHNPGFRRDRGIDYTYKGYKLRGWSSERQRELGRKFASQIQNGLIVEIGVFGGMSLLNLAEICIKNNNKLVGIDPWEKVTSMHGVKLSTEEKAYRRNLLREVRENLLKIIKNLQYEEVITLKQEFSNIAYSDFENQSIDLLFIDGDHSYDSVMNDLTLWYPKMKIKSTLWGDDIKWPSVKSAVEDFCSKMNISYQIDEESFIINIKQR